MYRSIPLCTLQFCDFSLLHWPLFKGYVHCEDSAVKLYRTVPPPPHLYTPNTRLYLQIHTKSEQLVIEWKEGGKEISVARSLQAFTATPI
jgi:hypothetical protein